MTGRASRKLKMIIIVSAAAVFFLTGSIVFYLHGIGAADPSSDEKISVEIPQGSGASAIVAILDENGLVKSPLAAKIHARTGGYDTLQANTYIFSRSMTLPEMLEAVNTGDFEYISKNRMIVREGLTIPQTAAAVAESTSFSSDELIAKWADTAYLEKLIDKYWFLTDDILDKDIMYPLEGYLYPETYFLTGDDSDIEYVTETMLDMTDSVLTPLRGDIEKSGFSVHELLTMASIVEREASNVSDEMPKIAGVFMNRLEQDMTLGSDVTVCYANEKTSLELTRSELDIDSRYNTRKYKGLPVGPICSVNSNAVDSILDYEESDYLFFFATEDGTIIYSETNEEHDKAVSENMWY